MEQAKDFSYRISMLRVWMADRNLDGILLTTADSHQSEDPPDCARSLRWLSGFTGSLARALILADRAIMFVDGRYQVQAAKQLDPSVWEIAHLVKEPPQQWLAENGAAGLQIAVDAMVWTVAQMRDLHAVQRPGGVAFVELESEPFQTLWQDRPAVPLGKIRAVPKQVSGMTSDQKLKNLRAKMSNSGVSLWIESRPDDVAWLFNQRGSDVPMHPVPLSYALIPQEGPAEWFIAPEKLSDTLPDAVDAHPPDALPARLATLARDARVGFDPNFTPAALGKIAEDAGASLTEMDDPITLAKARKNSTELAGFEAAHISDGCAWVNFLAWLAREVPARAGAGNPVTEFEAEEKIHALRAREPGFLEPSFKAISAAGANAAICHYNAQPHNNVPILPDALYLLDSGGQYQRGTTDATRTLSFGPVPDDIVEPATAVLRGFLALSMVGFPLGSFPHQLDALARVPLWALGLDYDHGTGHGVGHNLLVHEHPHRLAKLPNPVPLEPGNVLTIEPGYYAADKFGLRVENQVEVVASGDGFCSFQPMTLIPIDLSLFDLSLCSGAEITWLNTYHARVRTTLIDRVDPEAIDWLKRATAPI